MNTSKAERLVNLVILLLVAQTYVPKSRIRASIQEYRETPTDEAFEKKFERDKDELRALGIPLEVGSADRYFEDELGYRIVRDAFELPEIALEPDEAAVLGLAARVWQHAGLARTTSSALMKLRAAGHDVDDSVLDVIAPTVPTDEPAFDPVLQATLSRTPLAFDYRKAGEQEAHERHLEPWGVVTAQERWYVVGRDPDREAPRLFRLSRIVGEPRTAGRAGSYEVPEGTDIHELTRSLGPDHTREEAVLLARSGTAQGLRRWARTVETEVRPGWDRLHLEHDGLDRFAPIVLGLGPSVLVERPAELRAAVRDRLIAMVGADE